jgi:hypothetical protein
MNAAVLLAIALAVGCLVLLTVYAFLILPARRDLRAYRRVFGKSGPDAGGRHHRGR